MSSLFTPIRPSCTSIPLTPRGTAPGSIVKRLTISPTLVKIPVDSHFLLDRIVNGLASEARDWEVGVSWFEEVFRERSASAESTRKEELRLTILDSDSLPCQGFWPAYRAPELERVTHLFLARGLGWADVDWSAFPSLTHLAVRCSDHHEFEQLALRITRIKMVLPTLKHLIFLVYPVHSIDFLASHLAQRSSENVEVSVTAIANQETSIWDRECMVI